MPKFFVHGNHTGVMDVMDIDEVESVGVFLEMVCVVDLAGCVRWTWDQVELFSLRNTGNSLPWGTNVHTTGHHW